jgi:hypothetical protein
MLSTITELLKPRLVLRGDGLDVLAEPVQFLFLRVLGAVLLNPVLGGNLGELLAGILGPFFSASISSWSFSLPSALALSAAISPSCSRIFLSRASFVSIAMLLSFHFANIRSNALSA